MRSEIHALVWVWVEQDSLFHSQLEKHLHTTAPPGVFEGSEAGRRFEMCRQLLASRQQDPSAKSFSLLVKCYFMVLNILPDKIKAVLIEQ